MKKPEFTEEEIEELNDLYMDTGYSFVIGDVMKFLKTLGYSDVNAVVTELRKEFTKKVSDRNDIRNNKYPNSTLEDKLGKRLDFKPNNS